MFMYKKQLLIVVLCCLSAQLAIKAQTVNDTNDVILSWTLTDQFSKMKRTEIDTVLNNFEIFNTIDKNNQLYSTTGIMGGPAQNQVFNKRKDYAFFPVNASMPYLYSYQENVYYNTRKPFTNLQYTSSVIEDADKEETVYILHTQNLTQALNVGGSYQLINSKGIYNYQPVRKNSGRFFLNFLGEHYTLYTSVNINKHEIGENGGIHDTIFNADINEEASNLETRISGDDGSSGLNPGARNTVRTRHIMLLQKYRLGNTLADTMASYQLEFSHLLTYDVYSKVFQYDQQSGFYDNAFLNRTETYDSSAYKNFSNRLRIEFNESNRFNVAVRADLGLESQLYHYNIVNDTAEKYSNYSSFAFIDDSVQTPYSYRNFAFPYDVNNRHFRFQERHINTFTSLALYNKLPGKWDWIANADIFFTGYKAGDLSLNGMVSRILGVDSILQLHIAGNYLIHTPQLPYRKYFSNHFIWENTLGSKINIIELSAGLNIPSWKTGGTFKQTNIYNYVFINEEIKPEQVNRLVSINALELHNSWRRGILGGSEYLVMQQSTDEGIIDLPFLALKARIFVAFPMHFKATGGRLDHIIGFNVRYNTAYFSDAYSPALLTYYRQRDTKTGNYPFIDMYWNIKLKTVRFMLKLSNINFNILNNNYTMVPEYPYPPDIFKFGISWVFKN